MKVKLNFSNGDVMETSYSCDVEKLKDLLLFNELKKLTIEEYGRYDLKSFEILKED